MRYASGIAAAILLIVSGTACRRAFTTIETSSMLPGLASSEGVLPPIPAGASVLVDAPNSVGIFVAAAAGVGADLEFADPRALLGFSSLNLIPRSLLVMDPANRRNLPIAEAMRDKLASRTHEESIAGHEIVLEGTARDQGGYLAHLAHDPWDASNNIGKPAGSWYFRLDPMNTVENYLIALNTTLGGQNNPGGVTSRWGVERDFYRPGAGLYGLGRRLLFEVIHPLPGSRMRISLTSGLMGQGRTALPGHVTVNGVPITMEGNGAAQVTSPPIPWIERSGRYYCALDLGEDGRPFGFHKTGLMRLFGADIPYDSRPLVGFARDISLVSGDPVWPRSIAVWPRDLLSTEFSGFYEDGWVSAHAFVRMAAAHPGDTLRIEGEVPAIGNLKGGQMTVSVGGVAFVKLLSTAFFTFKAPIDREIPITEIHLDFQNSAELPGGDGRPVSAHITRISLSR